MKAEQLFRELDFEKKDFSKKGKSFRNDIEYNHYYMGAYGVDIDYSVYFDMKYKEVTIEGAENGLNIDLMKAIYQQMNELGWLENG